MFGLIVFLFLGYICTVPNEEFKWQASNKEPTQGTEPNIATPCMPTILEMRNNEPTLEGHTTLVCNIATCGEVSKIVFEKKDIEELTQWTQVFEGVDKTHYKVLNTDDNTYSLEDRYEYSSLFSHHILYIKPLHTQDQGEWRCVVYEMQGQIIESPSTTIALTGSQCKPKLSEGENSVPDLHGYTTLECDLTNCNEVAKIIYEKTFLHQATNWKPVYEGFNKTYHHALAKSVDDYSLKNRTPPCNPIISKHSPGRLEIGGQATLECGISTCENVTKIMFLKTFINQTRTWVSVFEGINKTHHHHIDNPSYSLEKRTNYTALKTHHMLYIYPVVFEDQGEWKCIVYDHYDRRAPSKATDFYIATTCRPEISTHRNSKRNIGGFTTIECGIATCGMVSKISFDKTFTHLPNVWTSVYEGINKTYQRTLYTDVEGYSLKNRTEYTAFKTQHILYIDPLIELDEGDWRCVVYNQYNTSAFSPTLNFNMGTSCNPEITDLSNIKQDIGGHTTIECDISTCGKLSKVQFEKSYIYSKKWEPVYEGVNNTFYRALTNIGQGYSLLNRADYTTFKTRHTLYIDPLALKDQGEWRCVAYDQNDRPCTSEPMEFYLATSCKPELSERSKQYAHGYTALECDFMTCFNTSRVEYEKQDSEKLTQWTPVHVGSNNTDSRALGTDIYSLRTRTDYRVLQTRHFLYIDPLKQIDVGEWRCVVYNIYNRSAHSNAMILDFKLPRTKSSLERNDASHRTVAVASLLGLVVALVLIVTATCYILYKFILIT